MPSAELPGGIRELEGRQDPQKDRVGVEGNVSWGQSVLLRGAEKGDGRGNRCRTDQCIYFLVFFFF